MQRSVPYTLAFAAAVCVVCSLFVSSAAVLLKERQQANFALDRQRKVLTVCGLMEEGERLSARDTRARFQQYVTPHFVDLRTGEYVEDPALNADTYDQRRAARDPDSSRPAPENPARVTRIPHYALIYHVMQDGRVDQIVLPIEGKGLWSTLYGFLALEPDAVTVRGLIFYEHGETPGLGGEVENPKWRAAWVGRKAYDESGTPQITVIKGKAGDADEDPYHVDGLSGATITSRSITHMIRFWLGEHGFGPYLKRFREGSA